MKEVRYLFVLIFLISSFVSLQAQQRYYSDSKYIVTADDGREFMFEMLTGDSNTFREFELISKNFGRTADTRESRLKNVLNIRKVAWKWNYYEIRCTHPEEHILGRVRMPDRYLDPLKPYYQYQYDDKFKLTLIKYKEYEHIIAYQLIFGEIPYEDNMLTPENVTTYPGLRHDRTLRDDYVQVMLLWIDKDNSGLCGSFEYSAFNADMLFKKVERDGGYSYYYDYTVYNKTEEGERYYEHVKDLYIDHINTVLDRYELILNHGEYFFDDIYVRYSIDFLVLYSDGGDLEVNKLAERHKKLVKEQADLKEMRAEMSDRFSRTYELLRLYTQYAVSGSKFGILDDDGNIITYTAPVLPRGLPSNDDELEAYISWIINIPKKATVFNMKRYYDYYLKKISIEDAEPLMRYYKNAPDFLLEDFFGIPVKFVIDEFGFSAISAGPDRLFGTEDDMVFRRLFLSEEQVKQIEEEDRLWWENYYKLEGDQRVHRGIFDGKIY